MLLFKLVVLVVLYLIKIPAEADAAGIRSLGASSSAANVRSPRSAPVTLLKAMLCGMSWRPDP